MTYPNTPRILTNSPTRGGARGVNVAFYDRHGSVWDTCVKQLLAMTIFWF